MFTDYIELMNDFQALQEKYKSIDRENYSLRQNPSGMPFNINESRDSISLTQTSSVSALTDNQKAKYEAKIKELETKLSKL